MAESADAPDSGSGGSNTVCVQVTLSAPSETLAGTLSARVLLLFITLSQMHKKSVVRHLYDTCTIKTHKKEQGI